MFRIGIGLQEALWGVPVMGRGLEGREANSVHCSEGNEEIHESDSGDGLRDMG